MNLATLFIVKDCYYSSYTTQLTLY